MTVRRYVLAFAVSGGITLALMLVIGVFLRTGGGAPVVAQRPPEFTLLSNYKAPEEKWPADQAAAAERPRRPQPVPLPDLPLDDPGMLALSNDILSAPGMMAAKSNDTNKYPVPRPKPKLIPRPEFASGGPSNQDPGSGKAAPSAGPELGPVAGAGPMALLRVVRQPRPHYPREARLHGIEGYVDVEFRVTRRGRVAEPKILDAYPPNIFEKATLEAMHDWRFGFDGAYEAATADPVRMRIKFQLTDP